MQLQMTQTAKSKGMKDPYTGMFDAARTIVREEGVAALYKGAVPALLLTSHGGVPIHGLRTLTTVLSVFKS
jgi:solute carrier family 25 folate transporter 32